MYVSNRYITSNKLSFLAEMIQAGGNTLQSKIHKLTNSILNKEELPQQWKKSAVAPIYEKDEKTVCSNYRGISLLLTTHEILPNILLSRLTP
jgi:hypothetical protein